MKIIKSTIYLLLSLFVITSCSAEKTSEPILSLSEEAAIEFSNVAYQHKITVTANDTFTVEWVGDSWGSVTATDKDFIIAVTENTTDLKRSGYVVVALKENRLRKIVNVTQFADREELEITNPTFTLDHPFAQEIEVEVSSANGSWIVADKPSWIQCLSQINANRLILNISENTTMDIRTGVIKIKSGQTLKEINVTQPEKIHFILPIFDNLGDRFANSAEFNEFVNDIKTKEASRKNIFIGQNGSVYEFGTMSAAYPEVHYYAMFSNQHNASVVEPDTREIYESSEYRDYLENKQGFEFIFEDSDQIVFWRSSDKVQCKFDNFYAYYVFTRSESRPADPSQPGPMPTWETLPLGFADWTAGKPEIKAWESQNGGIIAAENDQQLNYNYEGGDVATRIYKFPEQKLVETTQAFLSFEKAYFKNPSGKFVMTHEFTKLLVDEGYEFQSLIAQGAYYVNKTKGLKMVHSPGSFAPNQQTVAVDVVIILLQEYTPVKSNFKETVKFSMPQNVTLKPLSR